MAISIYGDHIHPSREARIFLAGGMHTITAGTRGARTVTLLPPLKPVAAAVKNAYPTT